MSDSTVEKILQLAQPLTSAAEVYYQLSQDTPVEFENNRLKSLQTKATEGVALRIIRNGRLGFASSTDLTRLNQLVAAAVQSSEIGDSVEYELAADVQLASSGSDYVLPATDELVAVGERLIEQVHDYNADILVDIRFQSRSSLVKVVTTSNAYLQRSSKTLSASLSGNLVQGEDFLQVSSYEVARDAQPNYEQLLQQLLRKYRQSEQQASIKSGSYPVLWTPGAVRSTMACLFNTLLSGQAIAQGTSPLADKVGKELFDSRLSIIEEPTLGPAARAFDDEGTLTRPKVLIEQGVVKQFYWDRHWANRSGNQPTGNGFRSGLSRPGPSLVNLCITPGQTSVADLIAGMDEGLIVDQVLGAGQSNQLAGEFSINLDLGYKVEQGEIVGRVKNTMVAGNIFEAFRQLRDLSNEPEWVGGSAYLPSLLFEQLGVASRQ